MTNEPPVRVERRELNRGDWQREGFKKIDSAMVAGVHGQQRVDVRFNQGSNEFAATLDDEVFFSSDFKALIRGMSLRLKERETLVFERYIHVNYSSRGESDRGRYGSRSWSGNNENNPLAGIYLEFDVYDISNEFDTAVYGEGPKGKTTTRVWRRLERLEGAWIPAGRDETQSRKMDDLLPFSEGRVETLLELKRGIARIDGVLAKMFSDEALESGDAALMLDKIQVTKLMTAPEAAQLVLPAPKSKPSKKRP